MGDILITGGLGYIGSHAALQFSKEFKNIILVDNLSNSSIETFEVIKKNTSNNILFFEGDIRNSIFLQNIFENHNIQLVVHLAALKSVPDSIKDPLSYYQNNIAGTLVLLNTVKKFNIKGFLFSSSAAIYCSSNIFPVNENAHLNYTNPYAETKLLCEILLRELYEIHYDFAIGILRYFNPLGNIKNGEIGDQVTESSSNIMPMIFKALFYDKPFKIYGNEYQTKDGTALRDYIHVEDLVSAHIDLTKFLHLKKTGIYIYNVGLSKPVSVLELIHTFNKINGTNINIEYTKPRQGDLPVCFADCQAIHKDLGWEPKKTLEDMCKDAFTYYNKQIMLKQ